MCDVMHFFVFETGFSGLKGSVNQGEGNFPEEFPLKLFINDARREKLVLY